MNKPTQKRAKYNDDIIKGLMSKYGFKRNYILMSIRGERTGTIPIRIQEEYNQLNRETKKVINSKIDKL